MEWFGLEWYGLEQFGFDRYGLGLIGTVWFGDTDKLSLRSLDCFGIDWYLLCVILYGKKSIGFAIHLCIVSNGVICCFLICYLLVWFGLVRLENFGFV